MKNEDILLVTYIKTNAAIKDAISNYLSVKTTSMYKDNLQDIIKSFIWLQMIKILFSRIERTAEFKKPFAC